MLGSGFPIDITILVRTFYLGSAAMILAVRSIPPFRDRFLDYGARNNGPPQSPDLKRDSTVRPHSTISRLLDHAATLQVSHSYFTAFYAVSAMLCIGWLLDLAFDGPVRPALSRIGKTVSPADPVLWWKPALSLSFLLIHSTRRAFESLFVSVPNTKSKMWVGHFAVGLLFFLVLPLAILADYSTMSVSSASVNLNSIQLGIALSTTTVFLGVSLWQYQYHAYLASLRKYTLPRKLGATFIVAPHYLADCLIFLCLAINNARRGLLDPNLCAVLVFVVVNLGVTADGTKKWMLSKFRDQQADIQSRWRMLPGLW